MYRGFLGHETAVGHMLSVYSYFLPKFIRSAFQSLALTICGNKYTHEQRKNYTRLKSWSNHRWDYHCNVMCGILRWLCVCRKMCGEMGDTLVFRRWANMRFCRSSLFVRSFCDCLYSSLMMMMIRTRRMMSNDNLIRRQLTVRPYIAYYLRDVIMIKV